MVKCLQLNYDSHMNHTSIYCVTLQCVTKLYLCIGKVLGEKMVASVNEFLIIVNFSDSNKIGGVKLKALTNLLLQWKSLYELLYRLAD